MGLEVLLDAWASLVGSTERIALLCIVGAGPQQSELESRCAQLGVAHSVRFAGSVEDSDLVRYYRAADVSVIPSGRA